MIECATVSLHDTFDKHAINEFHFCRFIYRLLSKVGMKSDISVFDPMRVKDVATFEKPHQYATGFEYVVVNGQVVFEGGKMTEARSGRVVYGVRRE